MFDLDVSSANDRLITIDDILDDNILIIRNLKNAHTKCDCCFLFSGYFPWDCCFTDGKRKRTSYTRRQIYDLEKEFTKNRYITRERRIEMSLQLNLSERQIKTWFQNRRMKTKREKPTKTLDTTEIILNTTTDMKPLLQANY